MKLIVCLDKSGGMLFNGRRQSRDRAVVADIAAMTTEAALWFNGYSRELFEGGANQHMDEAFLESCGEEDYCFLETVVPEDLSRVTEVVVYHWNRRYPGDFFFHFQLKEEGFEKISSLNFKGNSHDKITKEIYRRWGCVR